MSAHRLLLAFVLAFLTLSAPLAQAPAWSQTAAPERTPEPARTTAPTAVPEPRSPSETSPRRPAGSRVDRVLAACLRRGDLLVFQGGGLGEPAERRYREGLFLVSGSARLELTLQQRGDDQIIVRIPPGTQLEAGRGYRLGLQTGPGPSDLLLLGPALRPCADGEAAGPAVAAPAEVLASFRTRGTPALGPLFGGSVPALIADLEQRGLVLIERRDLPGLGMELLRLDPAGIADLPGLLGALRQTYPAVAFDLNTNFSGASGRRYGGEMIGLAEERCLLPPGSLTLGILDGAVDWGHPALARAEGRTGFPERPPGVSDHGTGVATLIAGDAASGFPGLLPGQAVLAAAVLEEGPRGLAGPLDRLLSGLDWLAGEGADLTLMALEGPANAVLEQSLTAAADGGMIMVAAVGNGGPEAPVAHPAASRWVFGVTAVDPAGTLYAKAARGPEVAFAAPGVDIWSARARGAGRYASGTSFAVPFAAAALAPALAKSARAERQGVAALTLRQTLGNQLAATAFDLGAPGRDPQFGWGLVQATGCP